MNYMELSYEEPAFEKHRRRISWLVDIIVIIVLAFFISEMFADKITIAGHSMEPAIMQEEVVLVDKLSYEFISPKRGDIISFYLSDDVDNEQVYVKRIIGLPGETVQIKDGYVYIDDKIIDKSSEIYKASIAGIAEDEIILGENEYFVLGDNRASSEDSRFDNVGLVNISQVEGKVWFRISPFEKIGMLSGK